MTLIPKLVAHRGAVAEHAPENTLAAFQRALELGADAVELDVRLSADGVPVVYHYVYLEAATTGSGPIWDRSLAELRELSVGGPDRERIPTLDDVLDAFAGRLGLEIELKGPEPEAVAAVAPLLEAVRPHWERIEVTSYETLLLAELRTRYSDLSTALLFPRSEPWMKLDFVAYAARHRARQARAAAVHLHPSQLTQEVVNLIRAAGIDVHAWDVNDAGAYEFATQLNLPWVNTDQLESALGWRADK